MTVPPMSQGEVNKLSSTVDAFNKKLKETQKIVSKNQMGEADFLKLLITQLKTQDPTKPMDDKQFIGQMAQFTSLKQMNNLTDSMMKFTKEFTFTKAVALVDKNVTWKDGNGKYNTGIVESVKVKAGNTLLNIGGNDVTIEQIQEVRPFAAATTGASQPVAQKSAVPPKNISAVGEAFTSEGTTGETRVPSMDNGMKAAAGLSAYDDNSASAE